MPPITKSQFKLGLDCIQKLKHARNRLPQTSQTDDLLKLLSEGGAAVEALVRAIEPGDVIGGYLDEAVANSRTAIAAACAAAAAGKTTSLYEPTIEHEGFLARIDLLRVTPTHIDLVEIKAKTATPVNGAVPDEEFLTRRAPVKVVAEWLPYVQDIAFQQELLERWLAAHRAELKLPSKMPVRPRLMLVDKTGAANANDLLSRDNYKSEYRRGSKGIRATVSYSGPGMPGGTRLLVEVPLDRVVGMVRQNAQSDVAVFANRSIADCMTAMKAIVDTGRWPDAAQSLGTHCKSCEFRVKPPLESGFDICWGPPNGRPANHFLELSRISARQFEAITEEHGINASITQLDEAGITDSQRMQYQSVQRGARLVTPDFAANPLDSLFPSPHSGHSGPIHFVDFETSAYPIPSRAGGRAYEHIPFQFEGHRLDAPGAPLTARTRYDGFLELQNPDPRRLFIDALMKQFGDSGPIFHWHHFERMVLNGIKAALAEQPASGDERRIAFIESLVGHDGKGTGRLVDLLPIAKKAFYSPAMSGSYSIKRVVPIAWAVPDIRSHFVENHGAQGDPDHYSGDTDPYDGLPDPPQSILEAVGGIERAREIIASDDSDDSCPGGAVRNGGMAMLAYHYVRMFGKHDDPEIVAQFRRYCRLDSAAMVMVYGLMRDHVCTWQAH
jgi:hypothetical protein